MSMGISAKMKKVVVPIVMSFVLLLAPGSSLLPLSADIDTSQPVNLIVQWMPQSQFAGYYVAYDKGFYKDHGVNVTVLRGGPDRDPTEYIQSGKAQFATMFLSTAIVSRTKEIPLVNIAQVINRSNLMVVAWKDKGINSVKELSGRRVSFWGDTFNAAFLGLRNRYRLSVNYIPQNYSVNLFLNKGVDACAAMYYNEYNMLYQSGVNEDELSTFFMRDEGFGFPEDGIYCLESTWKKDPKLCKNIADASLEGWQYAKDHSEEALDIVMKYVNESHVPTNRVHMKWMLNKIVESIFPGPSDSWDFGKLSSLDYYATASALKTNKIFAGETPLYETFYKNQMATK